MTWQQIIVAAVAVLAVLGIIILPVFNNYQFKRLPADQQIRIIMKQANGLIYFKNIKTQNGGNLFYVKNKRKILVYPWIKGKSGDMLITKRNPFDCWNYPTVQPLDEDEVYQARKELYQYSKKIGYKITFHDPFEDNEADQKPEH